MPLNPTLDCFLEAAAIKNEGQFIGSGSDGEVRDLCFDFPTFTHLLPFKTILFLGYALNHPGCRVELANLNNDQSTGEPLNERSTESREMGA